MTVKELYEKLGNLIKEGKEDYEVTTEAYCCGIDNVDVFDKIHKISID